MARPKKERTQRKTHCVSFRLTDAEFAELSEAAGKANLRINDLARVFATTGGKRLVVKTFAACDPALLERLHRIGLNLNQLVKGAHIRGRIPSAVTDLCTQIEEIITEAATQEWNG